MDRQYYTPRSHPKLLVAIVAGGIVLASGGYGVYQSTTTPGSSASTNTTGLTTYSSATSGYRLTYPSAWKADASGATAEQSQLVLSSPDYAAAQTGAAPAAGAQVIVTATRLTATASTLATGGGQGSTTSRPTSMAALYGNQPAGGTGAPGARQTTLTANGRQYRVQLQAASDPAPAEVIAVYEAIVKSLTISE